MTTINRHYLPVHFETTKRHYEQRIEDLQRFSLLHEWDTCRMIAIELERLAAALRDTENRMADCES